MDKQVINGVIKTLNAISVEGKDNLSKLLGCISALESILAEGAKEGTVNGG